MKNLKRIALFLIMVTMFVGFIGCKHEETPPTEEGDSSDTTDTTELPEVTILSVWEINGEIILKWKNPTDEKFVGVEVSMSPAEGTLENPVRLGKEEKLEVKGLRNKQEYKFTVKTIDASGNMSKGVSQTYTPEAINESTYLTPSTTEITQDPITVKVNLKSGLQVSKIYLFRGIINSVEIAKSTVEGEDKNLLEDITEEKEFIVTENSWYTVILQIQDTYEIAKIQINNIDASIKTVSIPKVGTNYAGKNILMVIEGNEFTSKKFDKSKVVVNGCEVVNIYTHQNRYCAEKLFAEIRCPSEVGTTQITVSYGKTSATTTLEVVQSEESEYKTGDIILQDKTIISRDYASFYPYDENNKPIGIIAMTENFYGVPCEPRIIGIKDRLFIDEDFIINIDYKDSLKKNQTDCCISDDKYIFGGDLDGSDNWEVISEFDPEGSQDSETNYPIFHFANIYPTLAGLIGTEFSDGWYVPSIAEIYQIYLNKNIIQSSLYITNGFKFKSIIFGSSSQESVEKNVLQFDTHMNKIESTSVYVEDIFVCKILNLEEFKYYDPNTEIIDVEIPTIAKGFVGEIPLTVTGKNLFLSFNLQELSVEGYDPIRVENISTEKAKIYVKTTGSESNGDTITVSCRNSYKKGTLKVVETENVFEIGDILLADGTTVSVSEYSYNKDNIPIGIIVDVLYGGGTGKFMGESSSSGEWAKENTEGYETYFAEFQVTYKKINNEYFFEGDLDGSDNGEIICGKDPEGMQNSISNYPIFYKANTYAERKYLLETNFAEGWYVPSVAELYNVQINIEKIKLALDVLNWRTIGSDKYWTSSHAFDELKACSISFDFDDKNKCEIRLKEKDEINKVMFFNTIGAGC